MKILLFVLMFFFILSLIRLRFFIIFDEPQGFRIFLKAVCFEIYIFPGKKKENLKKNKKIKKKNKKIKKKNEDKEKKKNKKELSQIVEFAKIFIKPVPKFLRFLNRGFKISELKFNASIVKKDAYETALFCCKINTLLYYILGVVSTYCKVLEHKINILADFVGEKSEYYFKMCFEIRILRIILAIFIYLFFVIINLICYFILKNKRSV